MLIDATTGASLSKAGLVRESLRFAKGLDEFAINNKIPASEMVTAIVAPNTYLFPIPLFGTLAMGGVVTAANPALTTSELSYQLTLSESKIIITTEVLYEDVLRAAKESNIPPERVFVFPSIGGIHKSYVSLQSAETMQPVKVNSAEKLAVLVFSSGTTGKSKGVMLSHRNLIANLMQFAQSDCEFYSPNETWCAFMPFYHIYGMTALLNLGIYVGSTVVVLEKFTLPDLLRTFQDYKVTLGYIVPPIAIAMAKSPLVKEYDISSVRLYHSGAAPLSEQVASLFYRAVGRPIRQGYGMSECAPGAFQHPPELDWEKLRPVAHGVGNLMPSMQAKVVDAEGKTQPFGQEGELLIRGPNVMLGYLKNNEATEDTLLPGGWLRTGDIARIDPSGQCYIVDRAKELIKYKGFQVAPAELEGYIQDHPDVADAGVTSIYDDSQATELPRAYVVPKDTSIDGQKLAADIYTWMKERTAKHKWLRGGVIIVDEIPKSQAGKILRRVLKEQAKKEVETKGRAKL